MKSANISSAIGRLPESASPAAAPMIALSEIGVSEQPGRGRPDAADRLGPAGGAHAADHVLAQHDDIGVALHFFRDRGHHGIAIHHLGHVFRLPAISTKCKRR
jgi:hypothetical protein